MNTYVEELYLKASALVNEDKMDVALNMYHELLSYDPAYAKAHNDLGWIYKTRVLDFAKAEYHFNLALKCNPDLPYSYIHLGRLYTDKRAFNSALEILNKGLTVPGADLASIYSHIAYVYECKHEYLRSLKYLALARKEAGNLDFMKWIKEDRKRVKLKMNPYDRFKAVFH